MRFDKTASGIGSTVFTLLSILVLACSCVPFGKIQLAAKPVSAQEVITPEPLSYHSASLASSNLSANPPAIPLPAPLEEPPLRLTFATSEPPVEPFVRPPYYEVPWALGLYDHFYFYKPIADDEVNWPAETYRYGDYFPDTEIVHTGIDIVAELGTPIVAAAGGKIIWAGEGLSKTTAPDDDPYGLAVVIQHDFGSDGRQIQTVYAHMARVDVVLGQQVEAGDQLGIVGTTGFTTGPHLHFEVRIENGEFFVTRNPELWVVPPQGWGVLAARLMKRDGTPFYHLEVKIRSLETNHGWTARTYGASSINGDDYYNENLVLGDLPAGEYEVKFRYFWISQTTIVTVKPGAVTYFTFRNSVGFSYDPPPIPEQDIQLIPAEIE